ncbi:MAG: S9 family peptidase [bacterium]
MKNRTLLIWAFLFISICFCSTYAKNEITAEKYLTLGPVKVTLPIDVNDPKEEINPEDLLKFDFFDITSLKPKDMESLLINNIKFNWSISNSPVLTKPSTENIGLAYLASYIQVNKFAKIKIKANSNYCFQLIIDGMIKSTKSKISKTDTLNNNEAVSSELELEAGKHLIIIKSLCVKGENTPIFELKAELDSTLTNKDIYFTLDTKRFVTISDMLDNQKASSVSVSPNGEFVIIKLSKRVKSKNMQESYYKIINLNTNSELQSFKGLLDLTAVQWSPKNNLFAYTTSNKNGTSLYLADINTGSTKTLFEEVQEFGGFEWAPNGEFLIYTVTEPEDKETKGLKKYKDMNDRFAYNSPNSFLYYFDINSGYKYQLTKGNNSTSLNFISPDSKSIIFSQTYFDAKNRPYSKNIYYIMNLETSKIDSLFSMYWGGSANFSPDGKKIAITGGPSEFNNLGLNLPNGVIPNDYDTQLYIYDIDSKTIESVTKNFNPSINDFYWRSDKTIYLTTVDGTREHLYAYNTEKKSFQYIDLGVETIGSIAFDKLGKKAVYIGASANVPNKVFLIDLQSGKFKTLFEPEADEYKDIMLGKVEDFDFVNKRGKKIEGFIHYPPDFDENKTYPCIVYYYGGTSPVEREFEGRYPKNIWAANGYIVYIVEPSGCTGYGQEFSALHVNDWGTLTAEEIIQGTNELLKRYKYIDSKRVGCIGASYGGFMTLNVITKTNIFAAAVSHAGISALTSYWGDGYWGYTYSAVATANSFPWNRRDIYVDKSSLFNADKINTPLLLLHGGADTNVPTGESIQMFTALKLLGKDVEFVEVAGQNHHILEYDKRILWSKSILAYFDKYLKLDNNWWNSLYKN